LLYFVPAFARFRGFVPKLNEIHADDIDKWCHESVRGREVGDLLTQGEEDIAKYDNSESIYS
jgi:hypothetical protein